MLPATYHPRRPPDTAAPSPHRRSAPALRPPVSRPKEPCTPWPPAPPARTTPTRLASIRYPPAAVARSPGPACPCNELWPEPPSRAPATPPPTGPARRPPEPVAPASPEPPAQRFSPRPPPA